MPEKTITEWVDCSCEVWLVFGFHEYTAAKGNHHEDKCPQHSEEAPPPGILEMLKGRLPTLRSQTPR